jgi:hypothetical protein
MMIAKGFLDVLAAAVMRRGVMTTEAEIRWHDELDAVLAEPLGGEPPVGSLRGGSFEVAALRTAEITAEDPGEPSDGPANEQPGGNSR